MRPFANEQGFFRKVLGVILILVAIFIITGFDKKFEAQIIMKFDIANLEQSIIEKILSPVQTVT